VGYVFRRGPAPAKPVDSPAVTITPELAEPMPAMSPSTS